MARQGVPNYPRELPDEANAAAAVVVPERGGRFQQQLLVDAGRVLMLWGWGTLTAVASAERGNRRDAAHAFLGLLLWLAGVSLVALAPVARRFPRAARLCAAVAKAVMDRFLLP